jgi:hypothetical protein
MIHIAYRSQLRSKCRHMILRDNDWLRPAPSAPFWIRALLCRGNNIFPRSAHGSFGEVQWYRLGFLLPLSLTLRGGQAHGLAGYLQSSHPVSLLEESGDGGWIWPRRQEGRDGNRLGLNTGCGKSSFINCCRRLLRNGFQRKHAESRVTEGKLSRHIFTLCSHILVVPAQSIRQLYGAAGSHRSARERQMRAACKRPTGEGQLQSCAIEDTVRDRCWRPT